MAHGDMDFRGAQHQQLPVYQQHEGVAAAEVVGTKAKSALLSRLQIAVTLLLAYTAVWFILRFIRLNDSNFSNSHSSHNSQTG